MRYTVEVSKVDVGSRVVWYNTRGEAFASAALAAFSLGSPDEYFSAVQSFEMIKKANCPRVTFQPSLKQWAITIQKHHQHKG